MVAERSGADPGPGRSGLEPEAVYYQSIEEFFVSRRGDPLFLSNADWLLIRKWRRAGVPLRIVLRGIRDALDSHAHSWARDRKVGSLAYCAAEVEAARERWHRALLLGAEPGLDVPSILAGIASALEAPRRLGPQTAAAARELARDLRVRAGNPGRGEDLEAWLAAQERELLRAVRSDAGAEAVDRVESAVKEDLAPYRERMPAKVLAHIRKEAVARRLLGERGLPRLSLFPL